MTKYTEHLRSVAWVQKRFQRLQLDGFTCQTCMSKDALEVHHKTYERLGDEDVQNDLITLCRECHEAITTVVRRRRYEARQYDVPMAQIIEVKPNVTRKNLHFEIDLPDAGAQRPVGGPDKRVRKSYESYLREARQD